MTSRSSTQIYNTMCITLTFLRSSRLASLLKPVSRVGVGLMLMFGFTACAPLVHFETVASRVSGCVIDQTGKPVSRASVEFLLRGRRLLGKTTTKADGSFSLGPFRQWFYLVYMGSPGVVPVPYTLEGGHGQPNVLYISEAGSSARYLLTTPEQVSEWGGPPAARKIALSKHPRWLPSDKRFVLTPRMHDSKEP